MHLLEQVRPAFVTTRQLPHSNMHHCLHSCLPQIPIKGCRDVCFSNGGQYFAAINGITLSIYNTYTCECVGNLRGHNGKVSSSVADFAALCYA
jgi:hypothetical protein